MTRKMLVSMTVLLAVSAVHAAPVDPAGETVMVVDSAEFPVSVDHASVLPGPGQWVMLGLGVAGVLWRRHRDARVEAGA